MTGLRNSYLRVIAAKEVLLKKYIFKDLSLFYGTIGVSLNISPSNNPAPLGGGHFVRVEPLEVISRQPDADRSKECHHRRHSFFTVNRDLKVVITAIPQVKIKITAKRHQSLIRDENISNKEFLVNNEEAFSSRNTQKKNFLSRQREPNP